MIRAAIDADKNGVSVGKAVRGVMKSDKQWDDPEFDSTDWAHPAWFRGTLHGLHGAIRLVSDIVSGKETGVGAMHEDGDKLRQMVLGLKLKADSLVGERDNLVRERDSLRCDKDSLNRERDSLRCNVERLERLERDLISEQNRGRHA